ncbi:MAG: hypothetical protein C3F11_19615 [Methylocystaceae bacterium]|nr:MAG: hypothetical protein C3F11_19615 [Methylocystaceae bacterium]
MSDEQPEKPRPSSFVSPQLYIFAAIVVAVWIFVTFFYRNPYQQAVSFDYYDKHPYDEATIWAYVLIVVPLIGLGALLVWVNRRKAGR